MTHLDTLRGGTGDATARAKFPVVVLGRGLTALGVIRLLGRQRIPCTLAAPHGDLATHSRWYSETHSVIEETSDPVMLEESLARLGIARAVLMPCNDKWAESVSRLSLAAPNRFPASICRPEVLELFVDKGAFSRVLKAQHVPHPHTIILETEDNPDSLVQDEVTKYFLKPRNSKTFLEIFGCKAFHFDDQEEMHRRLQQMRAAGCGVVLQEFIPGPATAHFFIDGFVDRDGVVRALFARQRLRIFPTDFGNSSAMISVPMNLVAQGADDLIRLLASVGYRGVFSAEMKRDERDGLFKFLEINARPWWFIEFAALCGVDVCLLSYRDALGERLATIANYEVGKRYACPSLDLAALLDLRRRGQIGRRSWLLESARAVTGGRPMDDPMPSVASALSLARRRWRRSRGPGK